MTKQKTIFCNFVIAVGLFMFPALFTVTCLVDKEKREPVKFGSISADAMIETNAAISRLEFNDVFASSNYASSAILEINATLQAKIRVNMTNDIVIAEPLNGYEGKMLKWKFIAPTNQSYTVTWPSNIFKIPTSSSMTNVITVAAGTFSQFLTEYTADRAVPWSFGSYVYGY